MVCGRHILCLVLFVGAVADVPPWVVVLAGLVGQLLGLGLDWFMQPAPVPEPLLRRDRPQVKWHVDKDGRLHPY